MFKSARSRFSATVAAVVLCTSSLVLMVPDANAQSEQSAGGLTGAWWVTVTQLNCATHLPLPIPPFTSMLLFSRGGTLTETTSNPGFVAGQRSTGFGTWALAADGTYTATDVAYILFPSGPFQRGTQKLSHVISLNSDASAFTDVATLQFFDINGASPYISGCASASAIRLR
jgi:hypothetical protein